MIRHLASACFAAAVTFAVPGLAQTPDKPAAGTAPEAAAIPGKIGVVDMEKLFQNYHKTFRDDAAFKKQRLLLEQAVADMKTRLEAIQKQAVKLRDDSTNIALSEDARKQKKLELQDKLAEFDAKDNELRNFVRQKNDELGMQYMELRNAIVKELGAFVADYGRKHQYELLLDTSGLTRNAIPAVAYFDKSKDITDAVLAELNKGHEEEVKKALEEEKKARAADEAAAKSGAAPKPAGP